MEPNILSEIREEEIRIFGKEVVDAPALTRNQVKSLLENATVLSRLPYPDSYSFDQWVDDLYQEKRCNPHNLKKYIILDYPIKFMQVSLSNDKIGWHSVGITLDVGNHLNAYAKKYRSGTKAIAFSESLFSFIWDFHHQTLKAFEKDTAPGQASKVELELLDKYEGELANQFQKGVYAGWPIMDVLKTNIKEDIQRWNIVFTLVFFIAHELGHLYLGHLDKPIRRGFTWPRFKKPSLRMYNSNQVEEFDADLFASDLYIQCLESWTNKNPQFSKIMQPAGFSIFLRMASAEGKKYWSDAPVITHPPSALRYTYICLRHKEKLESLGFNLNFNDFQNLIEKRVLPEYDYLKDLGTRQLFS